MIDAEWGRHGIETLRGHAAVFIIVDVLSFSTAVDIATARGAAIIPFPRHDREAARAEAARHNALLAGTRDEHALYSLSPASLIAIPNGTRLVLPSPNGSALSCATGPAPTFAGCLRNAAAVAEAARAAAAGAPIAVIPAGEKWPDNSLRPALEDFLGAGAIIHHLGLPCSPEAQAARDAWRAAGAGLPDLLRACRSGRELIARGFPGDVDLAAVENISENAPRLAAGIYTA